MNIPTDVGLAGAIILTLIYVGGMCWVAWVQYGIRKDMRTNHGTTSLGDATDKIYGLLQEMREDVQYGRWERKELKRRFEAHIDYHKKVADACPPGGAQYGLFD